MTCLAVIDIAPFAFLRLLRRLLSTVFESTCHGMPSLPCRSQVREPSLSGDVKYNRGSVNPAMKVIVKFRQQQHVLEADPSAMLQQFTELAISRLDDKLRYDSVKFAAPKGVSLRPMRTPHASLQELGARSVPLCVLRSRRSSPFRAYVIWLFVFSVACAFVRVRCCGGAECAHQTRAHTSSMQSSHRCSQHEALLECISATRGLYDGS
jgi:hypothetical protein